MKEKLIKAFKEALEIEGREVQFNDNFREYDEWNSLGLLSIIAMLDEEFGVEIETKDFAQIKTVQDLLDEIKRRIS